MSHLEPSSVDVRTLAGHPLVRNGGTSRLRRVAPARPPGPIRAGGLFAEMAEMAELRRSGPLSPEEMTAVYARHDQLMVGARAARSRR
jgi:hypothetical protein